MGKIEIGDVFEIKTPRGRVYLHYIYKDELMGELIRVLPGEYSERLGNLGELVSSKERYVIFFPLTAANKQKIVEKVGHYSSAGFHKPGYMRTKHIIKGEFIGWHIVNTENMQRQLVNKLSPEQKQLSPWGIWNDTLLIEHIVDGWSLEEWI